MIWEKELNDRKRAILRSIIDNYIQSAQPVGSRTIARKHELGLGSATIRNEMADLEELGYITQPHTSAGRIPSDKGYRFYVDHLMQIHSLAQDEMTRIQKAMNERIEEINQLIKRASIIVSDVTGYTAVIMAPRITKDVIRSIQLINLDEKTILVIVVAGGGIVKNKLVRHDRFIDETVLSKLSQAFNKILSGQSVEHFQENEIHNLAKEVQISENVITALLEAVGECVRKIESTEIYLDGITNILNYPEFSNLLKAREILDLLKEEEVVADLIKSSARKRRFNFKIGSENEIDELKDLSVITTVYGVEDKNVGIIGVIGPTRMTYSKVVSSIQYIKELLNNEIIRIFGDDS